MDLKEWFYFYEISSFDQENIGDHESVSTSTMSDNYISFIKISNSSEEGTSYPNNFKFSEKKSKSSKPFSLLES